MSTTININMGVNGAGGAGSDKGVDQNFKNEVNNKSSEDLGKMLGDKNLSPEQKQEVLQELKNRLAEMLKNEGDEMAPEEKKGLEDILKDLAKNGTKGAGGKDDPVAKLLEALGVPPDAAKEISSAIKNGGGGGDSASAGDLV